MVVIVAKSLSRSHHVSSWRARIIMSVVTRGILPLRNALNVLLLPVGRVFFDTCLIDGFILDVLHKLLVLQLICSDPLGRL